MLKQGLPRNHVLWVLLFLLWHGARLLQPLFRNPKAWRVLEFLVGLIMSWIALEPLRFAAESIPL